MKAKCRLVCRGPNMVSKQLIRESYGQARKTSCHPTINRFFATKSAAPCIDQKRTLKLTLVDTQISCPIWQNFNSTASSDDKRYQMALEHQLKRRAMRKLWFLSIIYPSSERQKVCVNGVKRSLSADIIKCTDRPIPPSTEN